MNIALIQMRVRQKKQDNLAAAAQFVASAAQGGADIAVLPEMFSCPYETPNFPVYAEYAGGESCSALSRMAAENGIWLIGGSIPEKDDAGRVYNTSFVFNRAGECVARHRKMHLFDIDVKGGQRFKESETLTAGNSVTVFDTEFGKIGVAICYDIRFPELSRLMAERGARVLVVPAAFNMTTGPAHWELTFRARALDNQVYAVGVSPARDMTASYHAYGNSIVTSPWGEICERLDEKEGMKIAALDLQRIDSVREQLPLLKQIRKDVYRLELL
ncbi:MAG: carbon-nitrogen hydrolase family protein [Pyramidobacter sp.]|nr:carbon-nitrogen hydrolase family protein [Pyramidobacter sp.]